MLPFFLALQLGGAPPAPPPSAPPTAPAAPDAPPAAYPPAPVYPPGYAPPPPGYGPYPAPPGYAPPGYAPPPYGYPPGYAPPPAASPEAPPPPSFDKPETPTAWFVRAQLGFGPPAFTEETRLLRLEGYGGVKFWVELDGGYLPSILARHLGVGLWGGISYWSSSPTPHAPGLSELDYMGGLEVPIRFGSRRIAVLFAPRIGAAGGKLSLDGSVPAQGAFVWGAQLAALLPSLHLTGSLNLLSAAVGPPGAAGRGHDLGGFYVALGGMFDG